MRSMRGRRSCSSKFTKRLGVPAIEIGYVCCSFHSAPVPKNTTILALSQLEERDQYDQYRSVVPPKTALGHCHSH